MNQVKLVYFSGTGGTERFALLLAQHLKNSNCDVQVLPLETQALESAQKDGRFNMNGADILILLFPVHAFDSPEPIYRWIKTLPHSNGLPVAIISVSAAGEYWINGACRVGSIAALTRKGYTVFYERMIIMPFNMLIATKESVSIRLMQLLPIKAASVTADILSAKSRRTHPSVKSRILTFICKIEKLWVKFFGKELCVRKSCTRCGKCAQSCPLGNIQIKNEKPQFGWHCVACLRCIYLCPENAIYPMISRFMPVKNGYNLKILERKMAGIILESDEKLASGPYLMFKDYFSNKDV